MLWVLLQELKRVAPLLVIILLSLPLVDSTGAQLAMQHYRLSMLALTLIAGHVVRKALFPYLDLATTVERACDSSLGAGLVALGMFLFLSVMLWVGIVQG